MNRFTLFVASAATLLLSCCFTSCQKDDSLSDSNIKSQIVGKWKRVSWNESSEYTNERTILTFYKDGTGYGSFSVENTDGSRTFYSENFSYTVSNGTVTYKFATYDKATQNPISAIDSLQFTTKTSYTSGGNTVEGTSVYEKVKKDYKLPIIGKWEGINSVSRFRLQFNSDGSLAYYNIIRNTDGSWVEEETADATYVVDGDWLAISYKTAGGVSTSEYWDITSVSSNTLDLYQHILVDGKIINTSISMEKKTE